MEARIGAFLQKAVSKAFGLPQSPSTNRHISQGLRPAPILPDSPDISKFDLSHHNTSNAECPDIHEYPNKRVRCAFHPNQAGESDFQSIISAPVYEESISSDILASADEIDRNLLDSHDQDGNSQFADGPARVVSFNDGGKACLALLITKDTIQTYNEMKAANNEISRKARPLRAAESEAKLLRMELEGIVETIEEPDNTEDKGQELHDVQTRLSAMERKTAMLRTQLAPFESSLRMASHDLQVLLGEAFEAAPELQTFLKSAESDEEEKEDEREVEHSEHQSTCDSVIDEYDEGTLESPEELARQAAVADLQVTSYALMEAQAAFDARHDDYRQELANYHYLTAMGQIIYTKTDFDLHDINHVRGLTERLRDAELQHEKAKIDAKALNVIIDPESGEVFDDENQDGEEDCLVANVDRDRIENWSSNISHDEDPEIVHEILPINTDSWEARPIDITESISMVDFQEYNGQIKSWSNHCSTLRQYQLGSKEIEDPWVADKGSLTRRSSM